MDTHIYVYMYIYIYKYVYLYVCIYIYIYIQSVPEKMRLEMLVKMRIEILDGGEILVNCKFIVNQNLNFNLYHEIQRNTN